LYSDPQFKFTDQSLKDAVDKDNEEAVEFFRLLALCHTVMVEEKLSRETTQSDGYGITNLDQEGRLQQLNIYRTMEWTS